MALCSACGGTGGTYGGYKSCYRCGGSGHGGFTDQACMACGGSGSSNEREWNTCWNCGGAGTVADTQTWGSAGSQPRRRAPSGRGGAPPEPWTRTNTVAFLLAYVAGVAAILYVYEVEFWIPLALVFAPAVIIGRIWKQLVILGFVALAIWIFVAMND